MFYSTLIQKKYKLAPRQSRGANLIYKKKEDKKITSFTINIIT